MCVLKEINKSFDRTYWGNLGGQGFSEKMTLKPKLEE